MSWVQEVVSIAQVIESEFPGAAVYRLEGPALPASGIFVIRLKQESRKTETRSHVMVERQYAITFYGDTVEQAATVMERLGDVMLNDRILVPIGDSGRFARIEAFSFDPSYEADNGLLSCTGSMLTQTREERSKETFDKINHIAIKLHTNNELLKGRDG